MGTFERPGHRDAASRRWSAPDLSAELVLGQQGGPAVLLRSASSVGLFSLDDLAEIVAETSRVAESLRGHDRCLLACPGAGAPSSGVAEATQAMAPGSVALFIDRDRGY